MVAALSAVARELDLTSAQCGKGAIGRPVVRERGGVRRMATEEWGEPGSVLELACGAARAGSCCELVLAWAASSGCELVLTRHYVESQTVIVKIIC